MLHSDQLAAEFAEILNANEIFAPLLPLDPAVTFYAPLRNNVTDLRGNPATFARASEAYYKDASGVYRKSLADSPRFEQSRLLMEPAQTNKCINYNAAPDAALINISKGGDSAAVLSRVFDADELASAGLGLIGNGYAIELDNSAGTGVAFCDAEGAADNTNSHTLSAWCRKMSGAGQADIRYSVTGAGETVFENVDYQRISGTGIPAANSLFRFVCDPGVVARFVLNQSEESTLESSPIVTEGTAGQRDADKLDYGFPVFLENAEGMLVFDVYPLFSPAEFEDVGIQGVIGTDPNARFLDHWVPNLATRNWRLRDETPNTATVQPSDTYSRDDRLRVAARWKAGLNMQIGLKTRDGAYQWSPETTYGGSFRRTFFQPWHAPLIPGRMNELYLYDEDRGTAWIEANH